MSGCHLLIKKIKLFLFIKKISIVAPTQKIFFRWDYKKKKKKKKSEKGYVCVPLMTLQLQLLTKSLNDYFLSWGGSVLDKMRNLGKRFLSCVTQLWLFYKLKMSITTIPIELSDYGTLNDGEWTFEVDQSSRCFCKRKKIVQTFRE